MAEIDPPVLAERVLRLSRSPPFDLMTADQLALLAAAGRERVFPSRTVLIHAGERSMAHYLPLAGRLRLVSDGREINWPQVHTGLGAMSVLGRGVFPADLVADPGTVLLVLEQDTLLAVLEEHGQLSRAVLRVLASKLQSVRRTMVPRHARPPAGVSMRLDLVSRMLLLREALGLGGDGMAVVARLARVVHARRFPSGAALWTAEQVADLVIVVEGTLRLHRNGTGERVVEPAEALGLVESVAGVPMEEQAVAIEETTAVVLSHPELTEAIEDDDPLCFELIRSFAAQIWTAIVDAAARGTPWISVNPPAAE
jgi:CRP-like cAMP-binding protein